MFDSLKKHKFKKSLKSDFSLTSGESELFLRVIQLIGIDNVYENWLQREYFLQIYNILPKIDNQFFNEYLNEIEKIDEKLFPPKTNQRIPTNTRDLKINQSIEIIDLENDRLVNGTIYSQTSHCFFVRIKTDETTFNVNRQVLIRVVSQSHGNYECLSVLTDMRTTPFPLISVKQKKLIHQEKRKFIRYPTQLNTAIIYSNESPPQIVRSPIILNNISLGGILFHSDYLLEESRSMTLELIHKTQVMNYKIKIIQRHFNMEKKDYYYRAYFQIQDNKKKLALEAIIQQIREK